MNKPSDQSTSSKTPIVKMRFFKQFIENLESPDPNILRIIQMRSDAGIESSLFSSDHAAWRDTLLEPYCVHDDIKKLSSLRWTNISTKNSVQFWRIVPAGCGAFFDVRSGQQLFIVGSCHTWNSDADPLTHVSDDDEDEPYPDVFTRWDRYLEGFNELKPALLGKKRLEAIRLEAGNRL
jgi:hypothetical protein